MKHRDINNLGVQRAYATFEVSNVKEPGPGKRRTFTGIASTIETDLMEDVVVPEGAEFRLPLPLLFAHDSNQPIGWVRAARVKKDRIEVDCEVADIEEADSPELKAELAKRWTQLKSGLVRGLSIGFNAIETAKIDGSWGFKYLRWKWLELSACVIAANQGSGVLTIKQIKQSLSQQPPAALGHSGSPPGDRTRPGASGQQQQAASGRLFSSRSQKGKDTMKTLKELVELRTTRVDRQTEITKAWEQADHERTDAERDELDEIDTELKTLDDDIRIARMHARHASNAKGVDGSGSEAGSASRGGRVPGGMSFVKKQDPDDSFKGQAFTRYLIAKAMSFIEMKDGNFVSPVDVAKHRWGKSHPKLVENIKAAVAGGGTDSGEWGAELAQADTRFAGDFVEFLYSMTVFDKLPLRPMPENVHVKGQDGAATGYWVGQSKAIPVSAPSASDVELQALQVGAIAVCSKKLIRNSSPSAELFIRDSIVQASAQRVDTTFFSTAAAVSGVSPAGILNGLSALAPSGTDAAAVRADMMSLYSSFLTAKNASGLIQIMTPSMAKALALLVNALGQPEFVGLNANGGTLLGDTVYTGDNVTPGDWILMKPSDIWKIGDSGVQVSMSDQATIEQDSAPQGATDTPVAASATITSMWQTESVAFKAVRSINYQLRRAGAVAVLSNAEYGGVVS